MMKTMTDEAWRLIEEFPNYEISDLGNVWNIRLNRMMRPTLTLSGHVKISLLTERLGERHTVSVAMLVAEAFVESPNVLCDKVVVLDGDPTNLAAQNLAWRPWWFAWRYTHQFKVDQPLHYKNLSVLNVSTGDRYNSIIACGIREGVLFEDIWNSANSGSATFPNGDVYEIIDPFL